MATLLELAQLSAAVYGDHPLPADSKWKPLASSDSIDPQYAKDGYFGQAHQNDSVTLGR